MTDICFVIQPFDGDKYDQLFNETYKPAIVAAGFQPYRVDEDPSASIPIEQIEKGLREAAFCFAEISEDNPNVWFELGMAIAHGKEVCLVCNRDRKKFPFDVQHRRIISYSTHGPSDFENLKAEISNRLTAIGRKQAAISSLPQAIVAGPKSPGELSSFEVACIGVIASNSATESEPLTIFDLRREMSQAGYTNIATNVAVRTLHRRGLISIGTDRDYNDNNYEVVFIENSGWEWVERNINQFTLREEPKQGYFGRSSAQSNADIPF